MPSTLRAAATLGGCLAACDWESELLATLLAYTAMVTVAGPDGDQDLGLAALLGDRGQLAGRLITRVLIATGGAAHAERTARTPADRPIVAAVARRQAGETLPGAERGGRDAATDQGGRGAGRLARPA